MKFAKQAVEQEQLARKAALALQQASSRAQIARNKMKRVIFSLIIEKLMKKRRPIKPDYWL